jgi:hypothetical protein
MPLQDFGNFVLHWRHCGTAAAFPSFALTYCVLGTCANTPTGTTVAPESDRTGPPLIH